MRVPTLQKDAAGKGAVDLKAGTGKERLGENGPRKVTVEIEAGIVNLARDGHGNCHL